MEEQDLPRRISTARSRNADKTRGSSSALPEIPVSAPEGASNIFYDRLSIRGDVNWTVEGKLTEDFVVGCLVGLDVLGISDPLIKSKTRGYVVGSNLRRTITDEKRFNIPGTFGWWIGSGRGDSNKYTLYSFDTVDFVMGFVIVCEAFEEELTDLIIGPPFTYEGEYLTYYKIPGHPIDPIPAKSSPISRRSSPIPTPYYSGSYEASEEEDFE